MSRPEPRPMFGALRISASGLSAQRVRLEVIAQNLANAETTRTPEGGPYQRRTVRLEAVAPAAVTAAVATVGGIAGIGGIGAVGGVAAPAGSDASGGLPAGTDTGDLLDGVRVQSIGVDTTEGPIVYDPGHPDADKSGYVRMPNVNMTDELVDLMNARRLYEANVTVFQVSKALLHKSLDI